MCGEPLTPARLESIGMILLDVLIELLYHMCLLVIVVSLPLRRLRFCNFISNVVAAEQVLTREDIAKRDIRVLHHIVHSHVSRRATFTSLAVEMQPSICRHRTREVDELIDIGSRRPDVIRCRNAIIMETIFLDQLLLRHDGFNLDRFWVNWHLVLVKRCYDKALTSCCVQAAILILEDLCLVLTEVAPIAQAIPADCIAVKDTVRLLTEVHDVDGALRLLFENRQHGLELTIGEFRTAGHVERIESLARRRRIKAFTCLLDIDIRLEGRIHRAEVARQLIAVLRVQAPDVTAVVRFPRIDLVLLGPYTVRNFKVRIFFYIIIEMLYELITFDVGFTALILFLIRNLAEVYNADEFLTLDDIIEADILSILEDIVHNHEDGRAAHAGIAVVMQPCILR